MAPRCVVGVDVGGTKLLAATVDEDLRLGARVRRPSSAPDQMAVVELLAEAVAAATTGASGTVEAVGVGLPATFDLRCEVAVQAVHLPVADLRAAEVLTKRIGLPVRVDNDANLAALAESRHGVARGARLAVVLTLGTGIGGAVVQDGRLLRGSSGAAGELGHVVIEPDGLPCGPGCPGRGCLETRVSGRALVREAVTASERHPGSALAAELDAGTVPSGPRITALARDGDPAAVAALARVGWWLGLGLVGLVNVFSPDVVVIGGGLASAGDLLLAPARAVVAERALRPARDGVRIVAARFGEEAGMIGAGSLALHGPA